MEWEMGCCAVLGWSGVVDYLVFTFILNNLGGGGGWNVGRYFTRDHGRACEG